jgi:hypothetical protein
VAIVNLVLPIAAHELDYRYAISAVPFACLALGLTLVRKPVPGALDAPGASGASGASGTSGGEPPAVAAPPATGVETASAD